MKRKWYILLNAEGGEGGGQQQQQQQQQTPPPGNDWRSSVPEELRNNPVLKDFKDVGSLAKSYVHAQSLIGADKIIRPNQKWTDKEWSDFYNAAGRPATHDQYEIKVENLHPSLTLDDTKMAGVKKVLHEAGLNNKQAQKVVGYYLGTLSEQAAAHEQASAQAASVAMAALKDEFGENFDVKLDIAKKVVSKFGGESLAKKLDETGLGNDPQLIKLFVQIGEAMLDDEAKGGTAGGIQLVGAEKAQREIMSLKADPEFTKSLTDRSHPSHKVNLNRWTMLHEAASPEK